MAELSRVAGAIGRSVADAAHGVGAYARYLERTTATAAPEPDNPQVRAVPTVPDGTDGGVPLPRPL